MKQTVFILSLALLAVTTLSFNIMVNDANDDKVKIDFYYESLCPYCQQFMAGALTKAANTKVAHQLLRISGKSANLLSLPTEMPKGHGMDRPGASPASTVLENVKETSFKLVHLSFIRMTSTLSLYLLSYVWSPTLLTGFLKEKNVLLSMDLVGTTSHPAWLLNKGTIGKLSLLRKPRTWFPLTPTYLGLW